MDLLSDWLRVVETRTVLLARTKLAAPWAMQVADHAGPMFHVVTAGTAWLRTTQESIALEADDLVVLPSGVGHTLSDKPKTRAESLESLLARQAQLQGEATHTVICGTIEGNSVNPLIPMRNLPRILLLKRDEIAAASDLHATLQLLKRELEAPGAGSEILVSALLQALLLYVLREWGRRTCGGANRVIGMGDGELSKAVAAIHEDPGGAWSLESLAEAAGVSRTALARRFQESFGMSPMAYVREWRMNVAARMLREERLSVNEVSRRLAYDSEFSFSRAFKRVMGKAPSQFRKRGVAAR